MRAVCCFFKANINNSSVGIYHFSHLLSDPNMTLSSFVLIICLNPSEFSD